jgi:hypothetical protein
VWQASGKMPNSPTPIIAKFDNFDYCLKSLVFEYCGSPWSQGEAKKVS